MGRIMMLTSLFSILSATMLPLLGAALGGAIIGGVFLVFAVLSIIYPYLRPMPSRLPQGDNWTKKYREGNLQAMPGRKVILDEIAQGLSTSSNIKTHPLLIGQSGVGKTETVKSFVAAIERGDYPELKGKSVFYFNTADLVNCSERFGEGNKILTKIKKEIGRNRKNVILVFDEIHLACQKKEGSDIGQQLKTLLDPGSDNFPYVIGMTTEEEFYRDIFKNNPAFARRFKRITIDNTNTSETLEILNHTLLQQAPKSLVKEGALHHLLDKSRTHFPQSPQPAAALKILARCIQKTAESQHSPLEKRVEEVRKKILSLHGDAVACQGLSLLPYKNTEKREEIGKLEKELQNLVCELVKEQNRLKAFYKARDRLAQTKAAAFASVLKVSALPQRSLGYRDKRTAGAFLLLSHYLAPALEAWIHDEGEKLGVKTLIDPPLIDNVIAEEIDNEARVAKLVEQGKQNLNDRNK
jgi:ATP-dependent Clp protease ATP-binding subunit ClpA